MHVVSLPLKEMGGVKTDAAQSVSEAIDVAFCRSVSVMVRRKSRGPTGAKVVLQQGSSREDSAFVDVEGGDFALDETESSDNTARVFADTQRFLRYRTEGLRDTEVTFCIDLMGRGNP